MSSELVLKNYRVKVKVRVRGEKIQLLTRR